MYGIYTIAATGLVIRSQTRWLPVSMGIAAATNVGLNLVLVPWIGYMGAAVGTLAGYVLLAALTGALAQRHYPVPWQYRRGVTAVAAGLALAAAALLGPDTAPWRVLCLVAYPVLLTLLGVLRAEEVRAAWSSLRRRSGQREGHVSKHSAGP